MPILKITLKNPKYCDGCPLLSFTLKGGDVCGLFGYRKRTYKYTHDEQDDYGEHPDVFIKRPAKCIEENGE